MTQVAGKRRNIAGGYHPGRMLFVFGCWLFCLLLLLWRAVDLHLVQHEFLQRQGDLRNLRIEPLVAHRGVITDRAGRPLAVSTPVTTLWANPREVLDATEKWSLLAGNPVLDSVALAARVKRHADREFVYLARHLAPADAQKVLRAGVPGIYPLTEYRRYYPAAEVTSHLVGFTNIDGLGQEGMELSLESRLAAESGSKRVLRDLRGRVIRDIELIKAARSGEDIALSIDLRLQYLAYRELLGAVTELHASAGSLVVLDAWTGEVLAMVNQPGYNPNNRARIQVEHLRNRALTDVFEPGSTIKPLTVAAALESGLIDLDYRIDTSPGHLRIAGKTIRDAHDYGVVDLTTLLARSSNVATAQIALAMESNLLPMFLDRFGLGNSTSSGFPGESQGFLPFRARWHDLETATLSYGYGLSVTLTQLAAAYATLANDGVRLPVTLLKRETPPSNSGEPVISRETARSLVSMMEAAVADTGTARRARVAGYRVAGKTGTVYKMTASGYADDRYLALFAGVAPLERPRYVVAVVIDDPRGDDYYGGLAAAPVFSRVMAGVLRTMRVSPVVTVDAAANTGEAPL